THAGYTRLMQIEDHPTLTEVLSRIAAQETRHIAFYASQARERLQRSTRARRLTRFALAKAWHPVGANVMPRAEVQHLMRHLLGGAEGTVAAERVDSKIDTLPGLEGLGLVGRRTASLVAA
ncbi:MAG: ferritin-like domain-containing protein, partial [Nocardioidaceae bacterium]